jgi:hypothetical protein
MHVIVTAEKQISGRDFDTFAIKGHVLMRHRHYKVRICK